MGLFSQLTGKNKEGNMKMLMTHFSGLPNFPNNCPCDMILDEQQEVLIFKAFMRKDISTVTLPLSKITQAKNIAITEIEKQSKTGRAALGGLLFGPAGAIVGALTADEKEKMKSMYVINYISGDEKKIITLQEKGNMNYFKFQKKLQEYLPKDETNNSGNLEL